MSYLIKNGHIVGDTGTDYTYVGNKPLINNNELTEGNHTSQDLGITKVMTLAEYNAEPVHSVDCLYIILDGDMQNPDANYNDLANKPSINGVVLTGNKPLNSLDLYDRGEVDKLIAASRSIRTVTEAQWAEIMADPEKALPNTVYYVPHRDEGGTLVEGVYEVYLFDANKVLTPMGLTEMDLSDYLKIIPYHEDSSGAVIYEIGHNEGKEDGRELESHSVINAINEIDTLLQTYQKKEDDDILVTDEDGTVQTKVVDALNALNDKTDDLKEMTDKEIEMPPDKKLATRQYCFEEAFKAGKPLIWRVMTWESTDLPPSIALGTSGMCICSPTGKSDVLTKRWGSLLWQSQGSGDIYVSYLNNGNIADWKRIQTQLYAHYSSFRLDAGRKFAVNVPIITPHSGTLGAKEIFAEMQKYIGSGSETFHRMTLSPVFNWTGLSIVVPIGGYLSIGGTAATANVEVTFIYWDGTTVVRTTENLGTVQNPTVTTYNQNVVLLN